MNFTRSHMIWCNLFLFLSMVHFANSEEALCSSENSCKCILNSNEVIDLSSVGRKANVPLFFDAVLNGTCTTKTELYSYNPCYEFDLSGDHSAVASKQKPCTRAAACVKTPGGPEGSLPEEHAVGLQSTAKFGKLEDGRIYINYTVPGTNRQLKVFLLCGKDDKTLLSIVKPECSGNEIVLNFTSKCACINGCSAVSPPDPKDHPGLSTGSVLLISFFTIFLAYLTVGVVWNLLNGAKGAELIPNLEFWNDLPVLIMEGISFTTTCFGKRQTYGEV